MTSPLWQSESDLGFPPGLCGFLAQRCLEAVLCVPAMYTRSPQLLLGHEPVGVHTQWRGGAPTTLRPETWHP